jgi:hypothetical protein
MAILKLAIHWRARFRVWFGILAGEILNFFPDVAGMVEECWKLFSGG